NQQILKLDPTDAATRRALEGRYERAGKFVELARMLEQALLADGAPGSTLPRADAASQPPRSLPDEETLAIRKRLVALYADELHQMERAMPPVEEVLRQDPDDERARAIAEQLLRYKPLAVRAATALEGVYDRAGKAAEAAQMLCVEVDHLRGPRRLEAQKRLGTLLFSRLGDLLGAFAVSEQIVAVDPADEEVRARYRMLAASLDRRAE